MAHFIVAHVCMYVCMRYDVCLHVHSYMEILQTESTIIKIMCDNCKINLINTILKNGKVKVMCCYFVHVDYVALDTNGQ